MRETMATKLTEAVQRLRERADGDAFLLAVADWMAEERDEILHGDPEYMHPSALRAAEAIQAES